MTALNDFYVQAAAVPPPNRRWCVGAGYYLYDQVRSGFAMSTAKSRILSVPQYANGLSSAGLTTSFNAIDDVGPVAVAVADFYVDPAGSDTADGQTPATAFRTLSKLQASLPAGKTAALKRGGRWRETFTIPADGVTISAYGPNPSLDADGYVTNAPVIDGGELVTGWSPYAGGVSDSLYTDDFAGASGASIATTVPEVGAGTWSIVLAGPTLLLSSDGMVRRGATAGTYQAALSTVAANPSYSAQMLVKAKSFLGTSDVAFLAMHANPSGQGHDSFLYAGPVHSSSGTVTAVRVGYYDHGANTIIQDVPATITLGNTYTVRVELDADNAIMRTYLDGSLIHTYDYSATFHGTFRSAPGQVELRLGGASTPAGADATGFQVDSLDMGPVGAPGTPVNTYQAALATDPMIVDLNGVYAPSGAGVNLLADGEYAWKSGTLYVRRNAGQPTNSMVVAGARNNAIIGGVRANITLQDIALEHTRDNAVTFTGGSGLTIRRVMAQITSGGAGNNGCVSVLSHAGFTFDQCIFRNCGADGVYMSACPNHTVTGNRLGPFNGPNADAVQHDSATGASVNGTYHGNTMIGSATSPKGLLILFGDDYLIENNYFEGGRNFHIACFGNRVVVRDNMHYNLRAAIANTGGAFEITDNSPTNVTDYQVYRNVFVDCDPAINVWGATNSTGQRANIRFWANTIANVNVAPTQWQVNLQSPVAGEFKDNILWDATAAHKALKLASVIAAQTWVSDYNDLGPEGANFVSYAGTLYATLAAYAAGKSQDAHSITADPLFVNQGGHATDGSDYVLQVGSPARGTGIAVAGVVTSLNIGAK